MNNRLLMSVAAAALIAGTGVASAQSPGMSREAPAAGAAKSAPSPSAAPSADRAAPAERAPPVNKDEATDTMKRPDADAGTKSVQSDDKVQRDDSKRATDSTRDNAKQPSSTQVNDSKAGKDMKADGRTGNTPANKEAADSKSSTTTTGQAGAGAKLSTEQRTKITTTIKQQNIKPVTNVNFSISIGTRVPRDVEFHPLPTEIVTVYPDWRGYDFILVNDQIIVINPRSYEIVAVIDA